MLQPTGDRKPTGWFAGLRVLIAAESDRAAAASDLGAPVGASGGEFDSEAGGSKSGTRDAIRLGRQIRREVVVKGFRVGLTRSVSDKRLPTRRASAVKHELNAQQEATKVERVTRRTSLLLGKRRRRSVLLARVFV